MAKLLNEITIQAPVEKVWQALADLESLEKYDPGVAKSAVVGSQRTGIGAERRCDLRPSGWFNEKVVEWQPGRSLAFELCACSLPVKRLRHRYTFEPLGDGRTRVAQVMEYELKMGLLGQLMDAMMVRKKWDAGIKGFFAGLKSFVEEK